MKEGMRFPLKKIAVICRRAPDPAHSSGELRFYQLIMLLKKKCKKLVVFTERQTKAESKLKGCDLFPLKDLKRNLAGVELGFIEFWFMGKTIPAFRERRIPVILDSVDVEFVRRKREARFIKPVSFDKTAELRNYKKADLVLVVSEEDRSAIRRYCRRIEIIPNIHRPSGKVNGFNRRRGICFVGSYRHMPNVDGLRWYKKAIMPFVKEFDHVFIGYNAPKEIKQLKGFIGGVEDARQYVQNARVSIAPLRYGAGLKGKVGESLACGTPVVTTPVGAEGFRATHKKNIWIARNEKEFIEGICRLYNDPKAWLRISREGLRLSKGLTPQKAECRLERVISLLLKQCLR